ESTTLSRVYVDANVVKNGLLGRDPNHIQDQFLPSLQLPAGSKPLLHYRDKWFFSVTAASKDEGVIPESVRHLVSQGHAARMTFSLQGKPALAVGIPLPSVGAEYFEIVEIDDLQRTLGSLGISLLGASVFTTLAGAGIGWWAGRRALRPLADVSQAAGAIAGG